MRIAVCLELIQVLQNIRGTLAHLQITIEEPDRNIKDGPNDHADQRFPYLKEDQKWKWHLHQVLTGMTELVTRHFNDADHQGREIKRQKKGREADCYGYDKTTNPREVMKDQARALFSDNAQVDVLEGCNDNRKGPKYID